MVTNDGRYVVTFDNWFGVGKDPIVVYDSRGKLTKKHTLESLRLKQFREGRQIDERPWTSEGLISSSMSSTYWNRDAVIFFNDASDELIVHLYWGYLFSVRLRDGKVMDRSHLASEIPRIRATLKRKAEVALQATDPNERRFGAVIAGSDSFREFIPRLRELLDDASFDQGWTTEEDVYSYSTRDYRVREAAKNALLALGEPVQDVVTKERYDDPVDRRRVEKLRKKNIEPPQGTPGKSLFPRRSERPVAPDLER
ncbi:MAG: hypothetical protein IPL39_23930 [Opitutaceae bacterium]|nr:hypothetical protein [Opitutaceae bacterium]